MSPKEKIEIHLEEWWIGAPENSETFFAPTRPPLCLYGYLKDEIDPVVRIPSVSKKHGDTLIGPQGEHIVLEDVWNKYEEWCPNAREKLFACLKEISSHPSGHASSPRPTCE